MRTRAGRLTDYALACGYVETQETIQHRLVLDKQHTAFSVRLVAKRSGVANTWDSFDTLKDARARFDELKKEII